MRAVQIGRVAGLAGLLGAAGLAGLGVPSVSAAPAANPAASCTNGSCSVTYTEANAAQTFTVPFGVSKINLVVTGGNGYGARQSMSGDGGHGLGAVVTTTGVTVTPGQALQVNVGGGGHAGIGGFNGGGYGAAGSSGTGAAGGASDLRTAAGDGSYPVANRLLVAGGGGGSDGGSFNYGGNADVNGFGGTSATTGGGGGSGATQSGPGAGGAGYDSDDAGQPGTSLASIQGIGGDAGGAATSQDQAGAGGGGYWGGGGGGGGGAAGTGTPGQSGGGGGGSSLTNSASPLVTGGSTVTGHNTSPDVGAAGIDGADGTVVVFYDDPKPTVTGLTPTSGSTAGGTTITITGTHFTGATGVTVGMASSKMITVNSDTKITAVTPAGPAGQGTVIVSTPAGSSASTSAGTFTYVAPVATSIKVSAAPASVPADGTSGSTLTAVVSDQFGAPFAGAAVTFGSSDSTSKTGSVTAGGGTYTAPFTAGTKVGPAIVTASTATGQSATTTITETTPVAAPTPTPTPTVPATPTPAPTTPAPTAPVPAAITLVTSATFVPIGTDVAYTGKVTRAGVGVAGASVVVTETYVDGKTVNLGATTSGADGSYRLTSHPLYIGTITAASLGATASAPSRVIVTYRSAKVDVHGTAVDVHAETRPGFITSANRQERAQILQVNSSGKQLKVLGLVNAAQRKLFPGEAQGTNSIDATLTLPAGTYYIAVKVIGTPVNTGASSKPLKVVIQGPDNS